MFGAILIANRGEIACRVMRTARRMGIRTVAVYSEADAGARHAALADEAHLIGPAPARDSYLRIDRIIEAARRSGAEAVHPGYGFLSENARFAEACAAAGLVFIGPPPSAMRAMGSKSAAKSLMQGAGVPLVPGYHGADQDPAALQAHAGRIGYPVLIKASAGGGGKGMRVVESAAGFAEGLALAKGEAAASFGDDQVLIERYLTRPRHIEIQVFADTHGNTVSLFERDCSIQRRHQKVIEEAPAPGMDPARRARMGDAACDAARAIGYVGAGTVEFITEAGDDTDAFYFMEMNTRLQVEHPVTEMVTGQDLVEWQLRVASGERLPLLQADLSITGHAIEARVYAEDPSRDFMPAVGTLTHLHQPRPGRHVRVDAGVRQGDTIGVHYDPMIAKLIVWDVDRPAAVARLRRALADYQVAGVRTNLDLLRGIARHPAFAAADLDTGFIARHGAALLPPDDAAPDLAVAAVIAQVLHNQVLHNQALYGQAPYEQAPYEQARVAPEHDPHSPWGLMGNWRMNGDAYQDLLLRDGGADLAVRAYTPADGPMRLEWAGRSLQVSATPGRGGMTLVCDGVRRRVAVLRDGARLTAILDGRNHGWDLVDPLQPPAAAQAGGDAVVAPMPGRIIDVRVQPGDSVRRGDVLVVLEAMKVQMRLTAPRDGTIGRVGAGVGDLVDEGAVLAAYEPGA